MADVGRLVDLGFERSASELLCNLIVKEAKKLGIHNVTEYHIEAKEKGWSKIINRIVKTNNRVYFASRANLSPYTLLQYLESEAVDLPSIMFHTMLKSPVKSVEAQLHTLRLTKELREARFKSDISKDVYSVLSGYIDEAMSKNAEL